MWNLLKVASLLVVSWQYAVAGGMISGTIKGPDGAPFRAAFVRAQSGKMATMVLSDNQGRFTIENLNPGAYQVSAFTTGYKSNPARRSDVAVADGQTQTVDFAMQKSAVQWSQLTKYQAGVLLPAGEGKDMLLQECFNCHATGKFGGLRHDYDGWIDAIDKMRRSGVTTVKPEVADTVAKYLANVFGPDSTTPQSPAELPEYQKVKQEHDSVSDDALNIVYVDYFLTGSPTDRPGSAHLDKDGFAWMEGNGGLLRLNPKTGETKSWRIPGREKADIHEVLPTPDGFVWLTVTDENSLARFDPKTEKFEYFKDEYTGPKVVQQEANAPWMQFRNTAGNQSGLPRIHTALMDREGNMWGSGRPLKKLDVKTGKYTNFPDVPDTYGIDLDKQGNVWFAEFNGRDHRSIGMVDVKTNKVKKWTPPSPDAKPRRLKIDAAGMVWFGDYFGGKLTRFDPKTEAFKEFKLPGPMATPYGMEVDHNGYVWYTSMYTDVTGRLDPKTGKVVEYPSPYGEKGTRDMDEDPEGRIWYGAQPYFKAGYVYLRDSKMTSRASVAQN